MEVPKLNPHKLTYLVVIVILWLHLCLLFNHCNHYFFFFFWSSLITKSEKRLLLEGLVLNFRLFYDSEDHKFSHLYKFYHYEEIL